MESVKHYELRGGLPLQRKEAFVTTHRKKKGALLFFHHAKHFFYCTVKVLQQGNQWKSPALSGSFKSQRTTHPLKIFKYFNG